MVFPRRLPLTLLLSLIFLSACSTAPPLPTGHINWQDQEPALKALSQWQLSGKLGVRSDSDASSASFQWQQQDENFHLSLSGTFGRGASITGNSEGAYLDQAGKARVIASSPAVLMAQLTGWQVPVDALKYWVRGLPAPDTKTVSNESLRFNAQGLPAERKQYNWRISYPRYQQVGELFLPAKMVVQKDDKKVTLIIKQWTLGL